MTGGSGPSKETTLGRAVAVVALAPVAGKLADEAERKVKRAERRRQLEEELAALPALERPLIPGTPTPWWSRGREFREVTLGLIVVGVPLTLFVAGVGGTLFAIVFGSNSIAVYVGAFLGLLCGGWFGFGGAIEDTRKDLRRIKEAADWRERYPQAVAKFEDREAERSAIEAKLEETSK
jgi:hypothetical protein